jgi:guanosine-3',5'-bis(diphosphate) 3'-pyrophosphohydrolase
MVRLEDILNEVKSYNPQADLDFLNKAYVFASRLHQKQKRASGEPYISHPTEVAYILTKLRMDVPSIAAGLLHDTVEDTVATTQQIGELFGEEIANIVDGVTKLSKIHFSSSREKQAENFRKMLLAMTNDLRVIIIKLADRLHNMRTISYLPEDKAIDIARETLEIYAPLCHRMGIFWMRSELEDLAFRKIYPQAVADLESRVEKYKKRKDQYIEEVKKTIRDLLKKQGIEGEISGRVKNLYSIYQKMEKQQFAFEQIYDIIAFRIIVETVRQCYEALGLVHSIWKPVPGRFFDYIAMPKANHYQSLHTTVIGPLGERMEIQIRTADMHRIAEHGVAAHWKYKEGKPVQDKDDRLFSWLRQILEWQQDLSDPNEFLNTVKQDLFPNEVYIFTPKGEVKELPKGATPVDFAYSVHSEIGNHCVGAKVNNRIVKLHYQLHNGDRVEILTSPMQKANKDWLKFVRTPTARAKIREFMRKEEKERSLSLGKEICEREFSKLDLNFGRLMKSGKILEAAQQMNFKDEQTLVSAIGYGKTPVIHLIRKVSPDIQVAPEQPVQESAIQRMFKKVMGSSKNPVTVKGVDDVLVRFAKCCSPLPGDPIIGFITRGRGVTLHSAECPKVHESDPERRVDVVWKENVHALRPVKIRVVSNDRPGLLTALTGSISAADVNIHNALIKTTRDKKAVNTFEVGVRNVKHLHELIRAIQKVGGVISVERVIHENT